jgi:hypothetical protein
MVIRTSRPRFSGRGSRIRFHPPATWHQRPLEGVKESFRATISIEKALGESVQSARAAGATWRDIGRALGVIDNAANVEDVVRALAAAKSELWNRMFASA